MDRNTLYRLTEEIHEFNMHMRDSIIIEEEQVEFLAGDFVIEIFNDYGSVLVCRNEADLEEFLTNEKVMDPRGALGLTLGYHPESVAWWCHNIEDNTDLVVGSPAVSMGSITFVTSQELLMDAVKFLYENNPYNLEITIIPR